MADPERHFHAHSGTTASSEDEAAIRTRLLDNDRDGNGTPGGSRHGTFSPTPYPNRHLESPFPESSSQSIRGDGISSVPARVATGKSATKQLAEVHGVKNRRIM